MEIGKIPPQDKKMEEAILGSLLIDSNSFFRIHKIITKNDFYIERNGIIFNAISKLAENNIIIDIITITNQLQKTNEIESVGGAFEITKLTTNIFTTSNILEYSKRLHELYIRRKIIKFSLNLEKKSYDDSLDIAELINDFAVFDFELPTEEKLISEIATKNLNKIFAIANGTIPKHGIKSGLFIDETIGGFRNNNLIVVGGRPGHGKTAFLVTLLKQFIKEKVSVGVFSLEMSAEQLEMRLKINLTGISNDKIKNGDVYTEELEELENATEYIKKSKIFINDKSGLPISEIKILASDLKRKNKIDIILIDYLQLIKGTYEKGKIRNRENEIAQISAGLKGIAKDLDIPVVVLAQLNRDMEKTKRLPRLSDLRESGAIEQDADIVMFLTRPEIAGISEFEDGTSTENIINFSISKNRDGSLGNYKLYFDKQIMTIKNASDELPF